MRVVIILTFCFYSLITTAQVNLVKNPGFEIYNKCPYNWDQIHFAIGWTPIDSNTQHNDSFGNSNCSSEYLNICANDYHILLPSNMHFYQYPFSGNGMASILMFVNYDTTQYNYYLRDYLQGRLVKKLSKGKAYCVSFYVNLAESSEFAIADIGGYFDNGSIDTTQFCGMPQTQYTPQVVNTNGVITDTANWTKIEGSFIAKGNEQFITIGNFKDRLHTTKSTIPLNFRNNGTQISYYLIDDVSVIESDLPAFAGNDRHIGLGDSTYIGRPQEVGLECTWAKLGSSTVIGTGGGIWVKPTTTTSYVVTQTLCGNIKRDTVQVEVWPLGLSSVHGQTQGYTLLPNPNHGDFELRQMVPSNNLVQVEVIDVLGRTIYRKRVIFNSGKTKIFLGDIIPGLYCIKLLDETAISSLKFLVQ